MTADPTESALLRAGTVRVPAPECDACRGRGRFELSSPCHWCGGTGLQSLGAKE